MTCYTPDRGKNSPMYEDYFVARSKREVGSARQIPAMRPVNAAHSVNGRGTRISGFVFFERTRLIRSLRSGPAGMWRLARFMPWMPR